jgi:hypothetical protein
MLERMEADVAGRGAIVGDVRAGGVGFMEAMREHVPVLMAKLRERFPGLKVTLQEID